MASSALRDVQRIEHGLKIEVCGYLSGHDGSPNQLRDYMQTIRDTPAGEYYDRNEDHKFTCASCECMKALAEAALSAALRPSP